MTTDHKIRDEKKALSSTKIDKYQCLTIEEILPSDQKRVIEQAKLNLFSSR